MDGVGRRGWVEGWKTGRVEGWKVRGLYGLEEEAQSNRMCYNRNKMDGVGRRGWVEGWKTGRVEEGMGGRLEGCMGGRKKHNLTECATTGTRWMV